MITANSMAFMKKSIRLIGREFIGVGRPLFDSKFNAPSTIFRRQGFFAKAERLCPFSRNEFISPAAMFRG
jgi:hypothetical protein